MKHSKNTLILFGAVLTLVVSLTAAAFLPSSPSVAADAAAKDKNMIAPVAEQVKDATKDAAEQVKDAAETAKDMAVEAGEEISQEIKEQTGTETEEKEGFNLIAATTERTIGDAKAPITVIEYASMTCSHCAAFHNNSFAQIKETYIDTGKVYWILREFPLDKLALKASQVARCTQPSMYFNFVEVLFSSQDRWAHSDNPMKTLEKTARLAGVDGDLFSECANNRDLETHVLKNMQTGQTQWEVKSTPTFIINYGEERMSGTRSFEEFQEIFDKLLKKSGVE